MLGKKGSAVLLMIFGFTSIAFASAHKELTNYNDLLAALKRGDDVKVIVAINRCNPTSKKYQTKEDILWSTTLNNFYKAKYPDNHNQMQESVGTSVTKLIQTEYGLAYDYARVRIFKDGSFQGYDAFVNPKDFTNYKQSDFHCSLADRAVKMYDMS